jgi:hypothetical protein
MLTGYKKVYCDHFDYYEGDYIQSELSSVPAVHFHHIHRRGRGNEGEPERVENLIALTFEEHIKYGDKKQFKAFLYRKHLEMLERKGKSYDREWILVQIEKYS